MLIQAVKGVIQGTGLRASVCNMYISMYTKAGICRDTMVYVNITLSKRRKMGKNMSA